VIERGVSRLIVSFDGCSWYASDPAGNVMPLPVAADQWLPELPEGFICEQLLLPVEQLLVRAFTIPLANPRLVDAAILGQELDDRAGIEPDEWWLSWQADKALTVYDGDVVPVQVGGMVFGLPVAWKQALESAPAWQQVRFIGADAWVRLHGHAAAMNFSGADHATLAVFDADQDGVFFGLWMGGICRGMRRINRQELDVAAMAAELTRTLSAMSGNRAGEYAAAGLLDDVLLQALALQAWQGSVDALADLPGRHAANLERIQSLATVSTLNFRHGHWAAASGSGWIRPWKRAMSLAAMLLLVWLTGVAYQNYSLGEQEAAYQQQIVSAFHQGLPDEKVMIDALAQLRRAAGGGDGSPQLAGTRWLRQLATINLVYKTSPWDMRELEWSDGGMKMSGKAGSLQLLNTIRQTLEQQMGVEVKLLDTDLSGQQVSFRMQWQ